MNQTAPTLTKEEPTISDKIEFFFVNQEDQFPRGIDKGTMAEFLHYNMKPYEDKIPDILKSLDYVFSDEGGKGGFMVIAMDKLKIMGVVVILKSGMSGYVPENLLLFISVRPESRGLGLGKRLINIAKSRVKGSIALHVEADNPARRLYERCGFETKYLEMRCI